MKDISLILKKSIIGFITLFIFTACDYKKTTIEIGSLFDPTFDFSKSSELTFDENNVEVKNGKVQLKPLDLKYEGDDFNNGSHVGTHFFDDALGLSGVNKNEIGLYINSILPMQSQNLVGYWQFENSLHDSSNTSSHLIGFGNPLFPVDSQVGGFSVALNGSNQYLAANNEDDFDIEFDGQMSIAMWFKPTDLTTQDTLISKRVNGLGGASTDVGFSLFVENMRLVFRQSDGVHRNTNSHQVITEENIWYHLAVVKNGNTSKIFINGVDLTSTMGSPVNSILNNEPLRIGYDVITDRFVSGQLDELAIWNSSLSSQNIYDLFYSQYRHYNSLSSSWTPKWNNIVGYWKMDGNWQDSSGNGHHLSAGGDTVIDLANQKVGVASSFFDGNGDYLNASPSASFDLNDNFSVSGWFRHTQDGREQVVFSLRDIINNEGFAIYVDNDTPQDRLRVTTGDGASFNNFPGGNLYIESGQWHHFIYSREGGNNFFLLDGVLEKEWSSTLLTATSEAPMIGARHLTVTTQQEFFGQIDDIAFFNAPLNIAEGLAIYHRQKQKYAGSYNSEVIDLGSATSNWPDLSWSTSLPFGKELVGDFDNDGTPDSESSSDYSFLNEKLEKDLVGLWHFNSAGYSAATGEIKDSSGENNHGELTTGSTTNSEGLFSKSLLLDGTTDQWVDLVAGGKLALGFNDDASYSIWVKLPNLQVETAGSLNRILVHDSSVSGYINLSIWNQNSGSAGRVLFSRFDGSNNPTLTSTKTINDFQWHQLVAVKSAGSMLWYIDGQLEISGADNSSSLQNLDGKLFFGGASNNNHMTGEIDDVSVWSRALTATEIQQLYRRGANRIKFQVKSCVDSTCECKSLNTSPVGSATDCDGDTIANALDFDDIYKAEFIGPGGNGTTYYSELFNRKSTDLAFNCGLNTSDSNSNVCVNDEITLGAGPRPTSPVISYDDFPLEARPDANPYFQYRVYMEADENTACNGSPCLPELTSVNLNSDGSDKFYGGLQEVAANKPISYSAINSLTVTADDCATFQLSPNGSDFYYWSSNSWVLATVPSHRSSKEDLETNIVSFSTQFGPGLLYIKSFLETNASQTQNCSVQGIDLNYSRK